MSAQAETSIINRLKAGMAPVPVYDIEAPDGDGTLPIADDDLRPFVGVLWGGPIDVTTDRGIVSTRQDLKLGYCMIRVCTPDADTNRRLHAKMVNIMTGYVPDDAGEMKSESGMQFTNATSNTLPTRYYRETMFSYRTNTSGMGDLPTVE